MTAQVTYLGVNSVGGSNQNPNAGVAYAVPFTVPPGGGWVTAIEVAAGGAGVGTATSRFAAGIYADDGGEPGALLQAFLRGSVNYAVVATTRWVTFPVGLWLPAGTYYAGVQQAAGLGGGQIRTTTGSSGDGFTIAGTSSILPDADWSGATVTATNQQYSIRVVFITEAGGEGVTGSISVTEGHDAAAAAGTITAPTFTGTVDATEADDTAAASGEVAAPPITGTVAVAETDDALDSTGQFIPLVSGSIEVTEADDVLAASGQFVPETITGSLAETEADDTLVASGMVAAPAFTGTVAAIEADDALAAAGAIVASYAGTVDVTEADDTLSAVGGIPVPRYREAELASTARTAGLTASRREARLQ